MKMPAIFRTWMGHVTLISGIVAIAIPYILFQIYRYMYKKGCSTKVFFIILLLAYGFFIVYLTIIRREPGHQASIPLPFWSYRDFNRVDVRWQMYMNAFMFIPFGSLVVLALRRTFLQTVLIAVFFSASIEAVQYITGRGFCEFDDMFNNTIGTVIGYSYWRLLKVRFKI